MTKQTFENLKAGLALVFVLPEASKGNNAFGGGGGENGTALLKFSSSKVLHGFWSFKLPVFASKVEIDAFPLFHFLFMSFAHRESTGKDSTCF